MCRSVVEVSVHKPGKGNDKLKEGLNKAKLFTEPNREAVMKHSPGLPRFAATLGT